ncbi:MAG: ADP-ribosylglycohydrolase family protein [Sedimentibacter sp.]|nr:ADP-ribosylglycohydrolase family protein [Sedimentibacter sp.]
MLIILSIPSAVFPMPPLSVSICFLSAGAFAHIIAMIIEGHDIEDTIISALKMLERYDNHKECKDSLIIAMALTKDSLPDNEAIGQLGEGWVGEEALSISIYCALKHRNDFREALTAAVNHDGDSDSTGAITGSIMGAYLGYEKIPADWIRNVELVDILTQVADDLLIEYDEDNVSWNRYPGY